MFRNSIQRRYLFYIILFICSSSTAAYGQLEHFTIEYITRVKGLSNSEITAIVQDKNGVVWIGTRDGLNRYDGYSIKVYQNLPGDSTSLCDNIITALFVDSHGNIWVGTQSNGVSLYDREKDRFINYSYKNYDPNSLSFNYVTDFEEDGKGNIWIGTMMGLNLYQPHHKNFRRFLRSFSINIRQNTLDSLKKISCPESLLSQLKEIEGRSIPYPEFIKMFEGNADIKPFLKAILISAHHINSGSAIREMESDKKKSVWLAFEGHGISTLDVDKLEIKNLRADGETRGKNNNVLSLCWDGKLLWLGAVNGGVNTFDPASETFRTIPGTSSSRFVKSIIKDRQNRIFIGNDKGLSWYDPTTDMITLVDFDFKNKLLSDDVSAIMEDIQGNFWVGSYQGGINLLKKSKAFSHLEFFEENYSDRAPKIISSVLEDSQGNLWVGFYTGGMDVILKDGSKLFYRNMASDLSTIGGGTVHKIFEDSHGDVWVGTYEGGLQKFDKKSNVFITYNFDGGPNKAKDVRDITEDKNNNIWFAVHGDGIKKYSLTDGKFTSFRADYNEWEKSLSNDWVFTIFCDLNNRIWTGSMSGISIYDQEKNRFRSVNKSNSGLSHNIIQVIQQDKQGKIWVGTQNGLNLFRENSKTFTAYGTKEGLKNTSIKGILEDSRGNLWISTNNGLSKIDFSRKNIKNYFDFDGLQSSEFVGGAFAKGKNGKLLFGAKNGLTVFVPNQIQENPYKPPVIITDFKLFNKTVPVSDKEDAILTKSISETKKIVLPYDQNVMSFEFAAINFIMPERNQYAYMMEGFEENWNYVEQKKEATYTNLNPGEYVFRVKASNNDGVWSEKETSLIVVVKPPIWLTKWAILLYVLALILATVILRKIVMARMKEKSLIKMNEMKLRFFANISHEFRTPLTLIIGPVNQLYKFFENQNNEQTALVSMMKRNSQRLLKLVNQLMNIYELDAGFLKLRVRHGDVQEFVEGIVREFESTAKKRNIYYQFVSNVAEAPSYFDSDKVEKIAVNIISNAFKYTPDNGSIIVYFTQIEAGKTRNIPSHLINHKSRNSSFVKISVEDTGKGISSEFKEKIFDRFFRIEDRETKHEGTGIGLYLARELAKIHYGDITLKSEIGEGTTFTIWLPVGRDVFVENELDNEIRDEAGAVLSTSLQEDIPEVEEQVSIEKLPVLLIVEDNEDVRRYLKLNFKKDYEVVEAEDGQIGLKKAFEFIPDVIISDVMMPVMDGLQLCAKVKKDERTNHIPVILLTARSEDDFQIKGLRDSGADDYITKPFNINILAAKITNCLQFRALIRKKLQLDLMVKPNELIIKSADEVFLEKMILIVEANISDVNLDVNKICLELGMSQANLYRKLQSLVGITVIQFIKNIRLKRAAQLILANRYLITEISYMVGFNDPKYFSKIFKKHFGVLPSEYSTSEKKGELEIGMNYEA